MIPPWFRPDVDRTFSNPVELPSIENIEKMDRQKEQSIESLEISKDKQYVKCQRCGNSYRIAEKGLATSVSGRITRLKNRLSCAQANGVNTNTDIWKQDKDELEQLLKEEEIKAFSTRLPLYSSYITGYRFYCPACYDNAYRSRNRKKKKARNLI